MQKIKGELLNLSGHGVETWKVFCPIDHVHIPIEGCEKAWCKAHPKHGGVNVEKDCEGKITHWEVECRYDDLLKGLNKRSKKRIVSAQCSK